MKIMDFSEAFEACDLKVGRYRQIIEFMKVYEYSRSRSFLDLGPRSFTYKKIKPNFLRNHCAILKQILYESFQVQGYVNKLLT